MNYGKIRRNFWIYNKNGAYSRDLNVKNAVKCVSAEGTPFAMDEAGLEKTACFGNKENNTLKKRNREFNYEQTDKWLEVRP